MYTTPLSTTLRENLVNPASRVVSLGDNALVGTFTYLLLNLVSESMSLTLNLSKVVSSIMSPFALVTTN